MKEHVRTLLGLGVLAPLIAFVVFLSVIGAELGAKVTFTYVLFLSAMTVFEWNRPLGPRLASVLGLAGGTMTIVSIVLPWRILGGTYVSSLIDPGFESWFVPQMIVIGGLASILSRFGGLVTAAGIWDFMSVPIFCNTLNGCPPISMGIGFWLGLAGLGLSIAGRPLNLPVRGRASTF